jgi:hypothetical protein
MYHNACFCRASTLLIKIAFSFAITILLGEIVSSSISGLISTIFPIPISSNSAERDLEA